MPLKNIFKKEEKKQKPVEKKGAVLKETKKTGKEIAKKSVSAQNEEAPKKEEIKKESAGKKEIGFRVLKRPHITEKASGQAENNKYIFEVFETTNKVEIAKTVEKIYKVNVENVNIVNIHGKRKKFKKGFSLTPGMKKAIVSIKKGQTIEVLPK